jgi:hypothetical protein
MFSLRQTPRSTSGAVANHIYLYRIIRDYETQVVNSEQEWKWESYFGAVPYDWPVYLAKRQ